LPIAQNTPLRPQGCLPKSSLESRFDRFENPKSPQDLERDDFSSNRHLALSYGWSMIFSENRCPARIKSGPGFFGIMLLEREAFLCSGEVNEDREEPESRGRGAKPRHRPPAHMEVSS